MLCCVSSFAVCCAPSPSSSVPCAADLRATAGGLRTSLQQRTAAATDRTRSDKRERQNRRRAPAHIGPVVHRTADRLRPRLRPRRLARRAAAPALSLAPLSAASPAWSEHAPTADDNGRRCVELRADRSDHESDARDDYASTLGCGAFLVTRGLGCTQRDWSIRRRFIQLLLRS